jgi:AraC-like DNA-binding protein
LDAGYGSHEAFTRGFREQFGVTPEALREYRSGQLRPARDTCSAQGSNDVSRPPPIDLTSAGSLARNR